jgi:non-ribosomal peptide synthetase-like protein
MRDTHAGVLEVERALPAVGRASPRLLHEFFERQAEERPYRPALEFGGETLSYRDLDARANQLAGYLREVGIVPGGLAGVCIGRSPSLYVALLAVLKAGAGYVPLDPKFPPERIRYILADARVGVLLAENALLEVLGDVNVGRLVSVDRLSASTHPACSRPLHASPPSPHDPCYVIYTSGTTGRPKGVMIEHRSAVNFVRAIGEVYRLEPTDRVYQGFSVAFDASIEEMWGAWSVGATLVPGSDEIVRSPWDLARFLEEKRVSFFSTVPTFLSMIESELPSVRLLVVGGEPCPAGLVERWASNGRRMLNTYGPTEATVVATCGECAPGAPVTIGRPLPGVSAYVLDEDLRPVGIGEVGELYLGGACLARGYVNLAQRTAESFVRNPFHRPPETETRLFRTRDEVRLLRDGRLQYLGRLDSQVKVRGFRIELAEIEAVLLEQTSVRAAAVGVHRRGEEKELAAFVVPRDAEEGIDRPRIADLLRARLPAYMVPKYLEVVAALPTLQNGKVDRAALPTPRTPLKGTQAGLAAPRSLLEQQLLRIWRELFGLENISIDDDFFVDLAGHSMLAARLVSTLRRDLGLTHAAVHDLYEHPTVRQLAARLERRAVEREAPRNPGRPGARSSRTVFDSVPAWERWTCVALQCASLLAYWGAICLPFAMLLLLARGVHRGEIAVASAAQIATVAGFLAWPAMLASSIALKWVVIGRYRPGRYPVWGLYYFRWWLVNLFQTLSWSGMLVGTPLMSLYFRLMGASVGRNATIDTPFCSIFDLVSIGDDASIGSETHILGYRIEDGELIIGRIEIGAGCFVGTQCCLGLDARMGDGARLDDLSLLGDGGVIEPGEARRGSPSLPAEVHLAEPHQEQHRRRRPWLFGLLHLGLIYAMGYLLILAGAPAAAFVLLGLSYGGGGWAIAAAFASVPITVLWFSTLLVAVKRLAIGKIRPGVYPLESAAYVRKWFSDYLLTTTRELLLPLFATLYVPPLLRLLGASIGARAEISTVVQISPDLLHVGDEAFLADGAVIGGRRIHGGFVEVRENRIGRRTFVGNGALVPPGVDLGDECLVGVASAPPTDHQRVPDGTRWLGSPSFLLPRTQQDAAFAESTTYRPPRALVAQRLLIDAVRILLPGFIAVGALAALSYGLLAAADVAPLLAVFAAAPAIAFAAAMAAALAVVAVKWVLMGTYRPTMQPLWSMYVWLNEVVNGAYEAVATPVIESLGGTPLLPAYLRLLGCKVGRWCYIDTTLFSEFDLVEIGDHSALNLGVTVQTHLFEDRIMKSSRLLIGDECSVGNLAVVLYDTEMKTGAMVGPLSLLMKGETLPPFTRWHGIPTRPGWPAVRLRRLAAAT